jgi:hypothetical protein
MCPFILEKPDEWAHPSVTEAIMRVSSVAIDATRVNVTQVA